MPTSFLELPGGIRNKIYGYVLLKPGAINLGFKEFVIPCYDLRQRTLYDWWLIRTFDELHILDLNLFQREHVMVQFRYTQGEPLPGGHIDGIHETLKQKQKHCTNLKTLMTSPYRSQALDQRLKPGHNSEDDIRELLEWTDVLFRPIPSLREIVVRVRRRNCPAKGHRYNRIGFWSRRRRDLGGDLKTLRIQRQLKRKMKMKTGPGDRGDEHELMSKSKTSA
ncbi:uncharacterized protein N7473_008943 [Penicillium subrubescens]|uniref:uncharacterized protein n=1 Tax=Penicillium subrubescens TaxID=1316194 RepID=UPI0025459E07|nr:uncharacterized protein N7473_008943 [Penicillium subrubescens]KAJ5886269.1 hypothetical protein N7473_008943 [Penicillium subrubescens]